MGVRAAPGRPGHLRLPATPLQGIDCARGCHGRPAPPATSAYGLSRFRTSRCFPDALADAETMPCDATPPYSKNRERRCLPGAPPRSPARSKRLTAARPPPPGCGCRHPSTTTSSRRGNCCRYGCIPVHQLSCLKTKFGGCEMALIANAVDCRAGSRSRNDCKKRVPALASVDMAKIVADHVNS